MTKAPGKVELGSNCFPLGYYDGNVHPTPSFYNPLPWLPIHVPPPKPEKSRRPKSSKPKYVWNPNKYL